MQILGAAGLRTSTRVGGRRGGRVSRSATPARGNLGPVVDERRSRVLATVDSIPKGQVATYGQVALEAGLPRRARYVGRCLRDLPHGTRLPWWRVVNASGAISPRGDGSSTVEQRQRLEREGVEVNRSGKVDLERRRWRP